MVSKLVIFVPLFFISTIVYLLFFGFDIIDITNNPRPLGDVVDFRHVLFEYDRRFLRVPDPDSQLYYAFLGYPLITLLTTPVLSFLVVVILRILKIVKGFWRLLLIYIGNIVVSVVFSTFLLSVGTSAFDHSFAATVLEKNEQTMRLENVEIKELDTNQNGKKDTLAVIYTINNKRKYPVTAWGAIKTCLGSSWHQLGCSSFFTREGEYLKVSDYIIGREILPGINKYVSINTFSSVPNSTPTDQNISIVPTGAEGGLAVYNWPLVQSVHIEQFESNSAYSGHRIISLKEFTEFVKKYLD
jgi:hypothetical protein